MDIFYKPPQQRKDECGALEENYMNCLMQKSLRDKVFTNRCVLDSVLWFHLECPRAVAKFDNPIHFKRKWRDFLSDAKNTVEMYNAYDDVDKQLEEESNFVAYPEDAYVHKEARAVENKLKKYSNIYHPDPNENFEEDDDIFDEEGEEPGFFDMETPKSKIDY